ncbi:MAG: hypothetical protein ACYS3N_05040 [Planctomycetota bacterium]|jgi:hypothetical protein
MVNKEFSRGFFSRLLVLSAALLMFSNCLLAAQEGASESMQYKIFPLKYIPVERGMKSCRHRDRDGFILSRFTCASGDSQS